MKKHSRRHMVQKSTAATLLILGLLVGGVLVWSIYNFYIEPQLVAQTRTQVNAQRDALAREAAQMLTGVVKEIDGATLQVADQAHRTFTVSTDAKTKIYHLAVQNDGSTKIETSSLNGITAGTIITVQTDQPIGTDLNIYAKEIIKQ